MFPIMFYRAQQNFFKIFAVKKNDQVKKRKKGNNKRNGCRRNEVKNKILKANKIEMETDYDEKIIRLKLQKKLQTNIKNEATNRNHLQRIMRKKSKKNEENLKKSQNCQEAEGVTKFFRKNRTEIGEADLSLPAHENVTAFDIAVQNPVLVQIGEGQQRPVTDVGDVRLGPLHRERLGELVDGAALA